MLSAGADLCALRRVDAVEVWKSPNVAGSGMWGTLFSVSSSDPGVAGAGLLIGKLDLSEGGSGPEVPSEASAGSEKHAKCPEEVIDGITRLQVQLKLV